MTGGYTPWAGASPPPDFRINPSPDLRARSCNATSAACARRERQLDTPEQRHRLRIAAKKARYGAEFFASLCAPKTVRRDVTPLTGLQAHWAC